MQYFIRESETEKVREVVWRQGYDRDNKDLPEIPKAISL